MMFRLKKVWFQKRQLNNNTHIIILLYYYRAVTSYRLFSVKTKEKMNILKHLEKVVLINSKRFLVIMS